MIQHSQHGFEMLNSSERPPPFSAATASALSSSLVLPQCLTEFQCLAEIRAAPHYHYQSAEVVCCGISPQSPHSFSVVAVSISPCCTTTTAAETEHKLDPRLKSRIEIKNMSRKEKPEADRAMEDTRTQCLKLQLTPPFSCQFE